jgi:hypothetical protein
MSRRVEKVIEDVITLLEALKQHVNPPSILGGIRPFLVGVRAAAVLIGDDEIGAK